jgi:hypothetical protein
MFRAMFFSIIRSTWLYLRYLVVLTHVAAGWCLGWTLPDTVSTAKCSWLWGKHRSKHVELTWNNKLMYIVHLVGHFHNDITMHGFMGGKFIHSVSFRILTNKIHKIKYNKSDHKTRLLGTNYYMFRHQGAILRVLIFTVKAKAARTWSVCVVPTVLYFLFLTVYLCIILVSDKLDAQFLL